MKEFNKFVCISYGNLNYLIPSNKIDSAFYCTDECLFMNGKLCYKNRAVPYINFYTEDKDQKDVEILCTELALVIKTSENLMNSKKVALIISSECNVMDLKYNDFSLFSNRISKILSKRGYIACYFDENQIYYLIDIDKFLTNFLG